MTDRKKVLVRVKSRTSLDRVLNGNDYVKEGEDRGRITHRKISASYVYWMAEMYAMCGKRLTVVIYDKDGADMHQSYDYGTADGRTSYGLMKEWLARYPGMRND